MTPRDASIDLRPGYQDSWRVIGYTHEQLENPALEGEVAGWTRDGEARTLEMVANLIAAGADFVYLQKLREGEE